MQLTFDRKLRTFTGPGNSLTLFGGKPLKLFRLSPRGTQVVRRWMTGGTVGETAAEQQLSRRLISAGVAHPDPPVGIPDIPVDVIIPVRDDETGLAQTLAGFGPRHATIRTITVLDDGSKTPAAVDEGRAEPSVAVMRHETARGPAAARNTAATACTADVLAFVDAGVIITGSELLRLIRHFADSSVVAAAPRIRSAAGTDAIARYERLRSPLDMGADPSEVDADRVVAYVPSAVLLVRRDAFDAVGGFDAALRYGEDVDLCWRLASMGSIRYDPSVRGHHPPRQSVRALFDQRLGYGSAAEPLAQRHGRTMTHFRTSADGALIILGLFLFGRPGTLAALGLWGTRSFQAGKAMAAKAPDVHGADILGFQLAATGLGASLIGATTNAGRAWWPLSCVMMCTPLRARILWAVGAGWLHHLRLRQPSLIGLAVLDDLAYGLGVWKGMLRTKSVRSILPHIN